MCEASLVIQFSIQYNTILNNHPHLISEYYDLDKLKVSSKRFPKKKSYKEVYDPEFDQPECIELPSAGNELYGFKLRIDKKTFFNDIYNLRKKCQLVLLYYNIYDDRIQSAITGLRNLIKLETQTDYRKYVYRFYFETARTELHKCDCVAHKIDGSDYFSIIITPDNLVYPEEVRDKTLYHIPEE